MTKDADIVHELEAKAHEFYIENGRYPTAMKISASMGRRLFSGQLGTLILPQPIGTMISVDVNLGDNEIAMID